MFRVESGFRWVTDEAVGFRTGATLGGGMEAFGFLLGWLVSSTSRRGLLVGCIVPGPANLEGRAIPLLGVGIPLMISFLKVNLSSMNIFFNEEGREQRQPSAKRGEIQKQTIQLAVRFDAVFQLVVPSYLKKCGLKSCDFDILKFHGFSFSFTIGN